MPNDVIRFEDLPDRAWIKDFSQLKPGDTVIMPRAWEFKLPQSPAGFAPSWELQQNHIRHQAEDRGLEMCWYDDPIERCQHFYFRRPFYPVLKPVKFVHQP